MNVFSRVLFNARESSYLRCGMPRNEELWLADENKKEEMRKKLCIPDGKKVILYAPTWRESTDGGKSYAIKPPIHFDEWQKELGNEYVVLFRAHHQTTKVLGLEYNDFVRNASDYPAVNDLMIAADILITDYSAIAFDYSILCRPIFCYAYDYDSYLAERGTYFAVDEKYPNKSCRTESELLQRIKSVDYAAECANTKRFRDEFVQYGVGATEIATAADLCSLWADTETSGYLQRISQTKSNTFQDCLGHFLSCCIHRHADEHGSCVRIIVGRTLTHQIRKKIDMIIPQLRNSRLLRAIIFGFQNFFIPPFIAGCRTEHAAHQVVMTIRMGKGMQCIVFIHTEMLTGNENCSGSPQRNIAFAFSHCTCSHCRCCIIAGTGNNFYIF